MNIYNDQHFISFGNDMYEYSKNRIKREAIKINTFKTITLYSPEDYDNIFKNKFENILNKEKGGGFWLWKVYFIKKRLEEIKDNDFLIYCDCGCTINPNNLAKERYYQYLDMLNDSKYGIISFKLKKNLEDNECLEKYWSIKEIFEYFNLSLESNIANSHQYVGGILIMQKKPHLTNIINQIFELLDYDQNLITDYYNDKDQYPFFCDARHDQSIWSIVRKIFGSIVIELDETYYNSVIENNGKQDWTNPLCLKYPFWATRLSDKNEM